MDKWKILQDEIYEESGKAFRNKKAEYFALNRIWVRMIELDIQKSQVKHEEIKKKFNL